MSLEPERRGRPWPAPSANGSPIAGGQWWRGGAEPFPLWPAAETREIPAVSAPPDSSEVPAPETPVFTVQLLPPGRISRVPAAPATPVRWQKDPRHPAVGLAALVVFSLLAGFFSWVSAEPFWLAVGHQREGAATVTSCSGTGIRQRCLATVEGRGFRAERVTLVGVAGLRGRPYEARMVSPDARIAYVGSVGGLHLRWLVGLFLVVLCGLGIAWGTGAWRLPARRARFAALGTSIAAPLALFAGMLLATW